MAMLQSALALAHRGMAVFPCLPRSKEPATTHGFRDASRDPAVIEEWWRNNPDCNVAIATGAPSGVFVIDIDGDDGESALHKLEDEHGALPPTVEVITARGRHVYFKMPNRPVPCSVGKIARGIDVRGDGGYVLTPPSVHPSGRRYCWSVDSHNTFAALAYWQPMAPPSTTATPAAQWRDTVAADIPEGQRDSTLTKIAGHLLCRRIDPLVALELLHALNAVRCQPPLPADDVEKIVRSVAGRELRKRTNGG